MKICTLLNTHVGARVITIIFSSSNEQLAESFNARETPTKWTVRLFVAKFWDGGSVADARRQVKPPMARSAYLF